MRMCVSVRLFIDKYGIKLDDPVQLVYDIDIYTLTHRENESCKRHERMGAKASETEFVSLDEVRNRWQ